MTSIHRTAIFVVCLSAGAAGLARAAAFPVGNSPQSVAIGDVNGDGIADIVTANQSDSTVSVLIGKGDGTFQAAVAYTTGASTAPIGVAIGDVTGDGQVDIVTANFSGNSVSILHNMGGGAFGAPNTQIVGTSPMFVLIADINKDGIQDILTANSSSNNVSVLLGLGGGSFQTSVPYATGLDPQALAIGDFNGDGKLDMATGNFTDNTVSILIGNGAGGFGPPTALVAAAGTDGVALGDFNGDGKLDIVAANDDANLVSVFLGNGDGTFQPALNLPSGSGSRAALTADFNGDGKLDFALTNDDDPSVQIYLGNGDGTFQLPSTLKPGNGTTSPFPVAFALGDLNKDGNLDMALADATNNSVLVLLGPLPGLPPVINSVIVSDAAGNPVGTALPGDVLTFSGTASDPANKPLTFTWDFGDFGTQGSGNPVTHSYAFEGTFNVVLTVSNGLQSATAPLTFEVFTPNSGAQGLTNLDNNGESIDPESGLGVEESGSNGGIIMLHIDTGVLRDIGPISTTFDGIFGRTGTVLGERPAQKFSAPGVFVATANVNNAAGVARKARKTLVVGRDEAGLPPLVTKKPSVRMATRLNLKGNFTFTPIGGRAVASKPDSVTLGGMVELPEGLDLSQTQTFDFSVGNVIDSINVDSRGKAKLPGSTNKVTKLQFHFPRPGKAPLTGPRQKASFQVTVSGTNLSLQGFDTEGVTNNLTPAEKAARGGIKRKIQLAFTVGGVTYEQLVDVKFNFKATTNTGSIGGRSAN